MGDDLAKVIFKLALDWKKLYLENGLGVSSELQHYIITTFVLTEETVFNKLPFDNIDKANEFGSLMNHMRIMQWKCYDFMQNILRIHIMSLLVLQASPVRSRGIFSQLLQPNARLKKTIYIYI